MCLESYIAALLERNGAAQIVLVRDDATSSEPHQRRKTIMDEDDEEEDRKTSWREIALSDDSGPPSFPFRKASTDELVALGNKRGKKKSSSRRKKKQKDTPMDTFLKEVAPGFCSQRDVRLDTEQLPTQATLRRSTALIKSTLIAVQHKSDPGLLVVPVRLSTGPKSGNSLTSLSVVHSG
jgi:hypothetical protein